MSQVAHIPWELSPAFEQWNAERRLHVVKALENFGAGAYNSWPNRATITKWYSPRMHPSAMMNYVRCGQQGVHRNVNREDMPVLKDIIWPNQGMFDVWFVPVTHGNTDNLACSEWELHAYVTTMHELVVFELGCNHTDNMIVRTANQYVRRQCNTCYYTWGIDTSG